MCTQKCEKRVFRDTLFQCAFCALTMLYAIGVFAVTSVYGNETCISSSYRIMPYSAWLVTNGVLYSVTSLIVAVFMIFRVFEYCFAARCVFFFMLIYLLLWDIAGIFIFTNQVLCPFLSPPSIAGVVILAMNGIFSLAPMLLFMCGFLTLFPTPPTLRSL